DNFDGIGLGWEHRVSERARMAPAVQRPGPAKAPAPLIRLVSAVGNRGFARTVARMRDGEGILPGGVVHSDVEAAIAAARGSGISGERGYRERDQDRAGGI